VKNTNTKLYRVRKLSISLGSIHLLTEQVRLRKTCGM